MVHERQESSEGPAGNCMPTAKAVLTTGAVGDGAGGSHPSLSKTLGQFLDSCILSTGLGTVTVEDTLVIY